LLGSSPFLSTRNPIPPPVRKQTEQMLARFEIQQRPSRLRRSLPAVGAAALAAAAGAAVLVGRLHRGG
jgi:hypothetical protein